MHSVYFQNRNSEKILIVCLFFNLLPICSVIPLTLQTGSNLPLSARLNPLSHIFPPKIQFNDINLFLDGTYFNSFTQ